MQVIPRGKMIQSKVCCHGPNRNKLLQQLDNHVFEDVYILDLKKRDTTPRDVSISDTCTNP